MGSPGDSPIRDLLKWGLQSKLPEDISLMLLRLKAEAPQALATLPESASSWTHSDHSDKGREFLYATLASNGIDPSWYQRQNIRQSPT